MVILLTAWLLGGGAVATQGATASQSFERFEASQLHMGTKFTIVLYANDAQAANRALRDAFSRIRQLDERLSDYRSDSELSLLSQSAPRSPSDTPTARPVSSDLWNVLSHAQELSRCTDGAFDVTVGPLTRLWRRARRRRELPAPDRLAAARSAVGYEYVTLHSADRSVTLRRPNMRLDLGGIAKGFAADEALAALARHGIDRAMVNAGGDMSLGAPPPDSEGWKIGIASLDAKAPPSRFLQLQRCGVATSGDLWQFVEINGRRYSHILDPRTGMGLTQRSSVTVVAPNGIMADSLASAVSVLGRDQGLRLVDETEGTSALFLTKVAGKINEDESTRFRDLPKAD